VAEGGVVGFGEGHSGRVEQWVKWSYADADVPPALATAGQEGADGVDVGKRRLLRTVRLDVDRAVEVPAGALVEPVLSTEITAVRLTGRVHWTVGFEASPLDPAMPDHVRRQVRRFLEGFPRTLPAEESPSYPAWLASQP